MSEEVQRVGKECIEDFGEQWSAYRDNDGYYGSFEVLRDIFEPILDLTQLAGKQVAEIGSGTGRIVNMLMQAGVAHVLAVEPSAAHDVLTDNVKKYGARVSTLRAPGVEIPPTGDRDYVFSVGVIQHIPDPDPVLRAAYRALKPGGKIAIWVYGKEGNGLYLCLLNALFPLTRRLPHAMLESLVNKIDIGLVGYMQACKFAPLPLRDYVNGVLSKLAPDKRRLTIYDQLNPTHAEYYTCAEAQALLERAGFKNITMYHRHNYSWSVVGEKPVT